MLLGKHFHDANDDCLNNNSIAKYIWTLFNFLQKVADAESLVIQSRQKLALAKSSLSLAINQKKASQYNWHSNLQALTFFCFMQSVGNKRFPM